MDDRAFMSIGEVLNLLKSEFPDVTISKIRFLESQGLLDPERTPSGYRKFYETDVDRLRWILRQQKEHFLPLKVIKGRLEPELSDREEHPSAQAAPAVRAAEEQGPSGGLRRRSTAPDRYLSAGASGASLTFEELVASSGLSDSALRDLERYGLIAGRPVAGTVYYDEEAMIVARVAAGFQRFGVEARHLRMYKTAAEREAGFFEQIVTPLLKQRNPQSRSQAVETLEELSELGEQLRASMLRMAMRDLTGA